MNELNLSKEQEMIVESYLVEGMVRVALNELKKIEYNEEEG